jgi:hypothetical protein
MCAATVGPTRTPPRPRLCSLYTLAGAALGVSDWGQNVLHEYTRPGEVMHHGFLSIIF